MSNPLRPRHPVGIAVSDLAADIAGLQPTTPESGTVRLSGATLDSRAVEPGDLYAALPGANVHGARFAAQAIAAGAAAVLTDRAGLDLMTAEVESRAASRPGDAPAILLADNPREVLGAVSARIYGAPTARLKLLGVTGTNGKTTTAYLLDAGLRALGRRTGLIGTIEIRSGGQRVPSVRTTPEACDLQGLFARMVEDEVDTVSMEVSSHALALHRVDGTVFDVAAFTNLSQDHLDFHADMDDYFAAKAMLFTPERARHAVVVVDGDWGVRMAEHARAHGLPVTTLTGAQEREADWHVDLAPTGGRTVLRGPGGERLQLHSVLPGTYNQMNQATAALSLVALGFAPDAVAEALSGDPQVPGRMQRVDVGADAPLGYVDFAHTPDAIDATLVALRAEHPGARIVAVLGAGGARDHGKRPAMGAAAARGADVVVVTDDNPRSEDPATIRAAVRAGADEVAGHPAHGTDRQVRVVEIPGRGRALAEAVRLAGPGGIVAALGKGHEHGQEIAGVVHPFDDVSALQLALDEARAGARAVSGGGERA